jgi:hypothetical protein
VHDARPALKLPRRLDLAGAGAGEAQSLLEGARDGVRRQGYAERVLHSTRIMTATGIMLAAILRRGESGPQRA